MVPKLREIVTIIGYLLESWLQIQHFHCKNRQYIFQSTLSGEKKQKPEDLLQKLRKLEENKHCANCGEFAKLGHTNVCGNFRRVALMH